MIPRLAWGCAVMVGSGTPSMPPKRRLSLPIVTTIKCFTHPREMSLKLPWKAQLGTGDVSVVTSPVVRAHGPPGSSCENLQHGALAAHTDCPVHGRKGP